MSLPISRPEPTKLGEALTDPHRPVSVEVSASGVDAAQVRTLRDKTPLERLDWLEEFLEAADELRGKLRGSRAR